LTGKGGDDIFVFAHVVAVNGPDQITDFNVADDQIELDNAIFAGLLVGTLTSIRFVANTTGQATTNLHRITYDTDDGGLYYDADGKGAGVRVLFAELDAGLSLRAGDFNII
jgi:serralysin